MKTTSKLALLAIVGTLIGCGINAHADGFFTKNNCSYISVFGTDLEGKSDAGDTSMWGLLTAWARAESAAKTRLESACDRHECAAASPGTYSLGPELSGVTYTASSGYPKIVSGRWVVRVSASAECCCVYYASTN